MKPDCKHPLEHAKKQIEEMGVVVYKNIKSMPVYGVPYISPQLVICLCHRGEVILEYDMQPREFHANEISVVYPNHILKVHSSSEDYLATIIVISKDFLKNLQHRSSHRYQLEYQKRPAFRLSDEQFKVIVSATDVIEAISNLNSPLRDTMLANILDTYSPLVDESRFHEKGDLPEWNKGERLYYRFYEAITQHFHESHEIKFYANLLCLTPKYFATLIKKETGKGASEWIAEYIIIQAKSLLTTRNDLTIQQITERLGFPEQSSFSRFFKQQTKLTPREYRSLQTQSIKN
jgi:AraC-like DNA-binding protein